jgi:hypothetical protein
MEFLEHARLLFIILLAYLSYRNLNNISALEYTSSEDEE